GGQRRGPAARGPVRPQGAGGAGQAAGGSGTMTSPRPAVKPLIVAVDDDPAVLAAVSRDLRRHYGESYRVVRADSGARALELVQEAKLRGDDVALFLADQRMPRMSGLEFLEQARELYPDARRVLLTA